MRLISLDALRGVAAMSVAVPHFFMSRLESAEVWEALSILSVEIFFVLSGFVLAPQILHCLAGDTANRLRIFLVRRWMRTLPPYMLALTVTAILSAALFSQQFVKLTFFLQNFVAIADDADFFAVAWSLSVEEWFYIIFPVYLIGARAAGLGLGASLGGFFAAILAARTAGAYLDPEWTASARRIVVFRLDAIAFGFALRLWLDRLQSDRRRLADICALPLVCVSGGLIAWLLTAIAAGGSVAHWMAYFYLAPVFASAVLVAFLAREAWWTRSPLRGRIGRLGGDLSYDIYLIHTAALLVAGRMQLGMGLAVELAAVLLLTVAASAAMRYFVEQPILDARPNYGG